MGRFNTTTKGYKYDKVLFWLTYLAVILIVGKIWLTHGIAANPYMNCTEDIGCFNPFSSEIYYDCTFGFGFLDCPINHYDWMEEEYLPKGEYGTPPVSFSWFFPAVIALFGLAFMLNHLMWNKGKRFHMSSKLIDWIKKHQDENEGGKE